MDNEQLRDLIRQGVVSEVIGSKARVTFEDRDGVVSAPLSVLQMYTGSNKAIRMPEVGESVVCIFLPTGLEDGYIIGSVYVDGNNPPADNNAVQFGDGSFMNISDGTLNINMLTAINFTTPLFTVNGDALISGNMSTTGTSQTQGSLSVTGAIHSDDDVTASGVSLKGHTNGGYGVDQ